MKYVFTIPLFLVFSFFMGKWTEAPPIQEKSWQTVSINSNELTDGPLILVNKSIALQEDPTDLIDIADQLKGLIQTGNEVIIQSQVMDPLLQMITEANKAGFKRLNLTSSFRNSELQKKLFEEIGEEYALPPGKSEHQTGLAVDISITYGKIEGTKEAKWLADNAPLYGFILRYPKDKTHITGIEFEPWHFRYVGFPHSKIMQEKDYVLEEYIEFLREQKSFVYETNGVYYTINYIPSGELTEITYPWYVDFQYSGSNDNGLITTSIVRNPYQ